MNTSGPPRVLILDNDRSLLEAYVERSSGRWKFSLSPQAGDTSESVGTREGQRRANAMAQELSSITFLWDGHEYLVRIYHDPQRRGRGAYQAVTELAPQDWVISDGASPDDVVRKQQDILPLAILARTLVGTPEAAVSGNTS